MSTEFAVPSQRNARTKHDNNGDVIVAAIWLAFYLLIVVPELFMNQTKFLVTLVLIVAVLGGWCVLGWRRKKKGKLLPVYKNMRPDSGKTATLTESDYRKAVESIGFGGPTIVRIDLASLRVPSK